MSFFHFIIYTKCLNLAMCTRTATEPPPPIVSPYDDTTTTCQHTLRTTCHQLPDTTMRHRGERQRAAAGDEGGFETRRDARLEPQVCFISSFFTYTNLKKKTSYICTERQQTATTTAHRPNDGINCCSGHKHYEPRHATTTNTPLHVTTGNNDGTPQRRHVKTCPPPA